MSSTPPPPSQPQPEPVPPVQPIEQDPSARQMAMLSHLLGIFTSIFGALIIWLLKKDMPFVEDQAKEALNFQIAVAIAGVVAGLTTFICIGFLLVPVVVVANIIFCIMGTLKANQGIRYRYPVTLRLIK